MIFLNSCRHIQKWLVNLNYKTGYLSFFCLAVIPILISISIGTFFPYDAKISKWDKTIHFEGYNESYNWLLFPITLPLFLFILRWVTNFLFLNSDIGPKSFTLIQMINAKRDCLKNRLVKIAHDPWNLIIAFFLNTAAHIKDLDSIAIYYYAYFKNIKFSRTSKDLNEPGWSELFWALPPQELNGEKNLIHVISAYSCQFILGLMGILLIILFIRFNFLYLNLIYQRRRITPDKTKDEFINLNIKDKDLFFGLSNLNGLFNVQIIFLIFCGFIILTSRLENVKTEESLTIYEALTKVDPVQIIWKNDVVTKELSKNLNYKNLFPDIGQKILAVAWLILLIGVSLPAYSKFLPLKGKFPFLKVVGRTTYLLEFIPPDEVEALLKKKEEDLDIEDIDKLHNHFWKNSFWPSGDTIASIIFWLSINVFLYILIPLEPISGYERHFFEYILYIFILSGIITYLWFFILKKLLSFLIHDL